MNSRSWVADTTVTATREIPATHAPRYRWNSNPDTRVEPDLHANRARSYPGVLRRRDAVGPCRSPGHREVLVRLHRARDTASIRGATVTIDHTIEAGTTDSAGIVRIPDLLDGGHIIEVVARGYQAYFDNFNSGAGVQQPIQLELLPIPPSDTAKAKGQETPLRFVGFNAPRTKGQRNFFTRAQLDAASGRPLANLLKMDAGAFIVPGPHGESQLALPSPVSASSPCYAAVVRDGVRIYPFAGANPPDLDKISAEEVTGIELDPRPATVPAELRDAASCGALVLWIRDRAR